MSNVFPPPNTNEFLVLLKSSSSFPSVFHAITVKILIEAGQAAKHFHIRSLYPTVLSTWEEDSQRSTEYRAVCLNPHQPKIRPKSGNVYFSAPCLRLRPLTP
ncbi:hypothetical protein [Candidatus Hadarchaeum sp.]|uniref:hypothetical protein n=1 Tax=Candidatus Hadarchaeum sp. TaxID=2883567 RepID=UPI00319DCC6D